MSDSNGLHDLCKIGCALRPAIHRVSATGRVVAATVHNSRARVDVGLVRKIHSSVGPIAQCIHVHPTICIDVGLNRIEPIEKPSNPFQWCRGIWLTDCLWILAEIDVTIQHFAPFVLSTLAHVVIQLAKIANSGGLDYATAPPAATLNVCSALSAKDRSLVACAT